MMRKLYPLPIQSVLEHPDFIALPAAGAGMLFRLLGHYWETGATSIPIADHELRAVCRAHTATWRIWKPTILKIFNAVAPELAAYKRLRDVKGTSIRVMQRSGAATTNAIRRAKAIELSHTSPETPQGPLIPSQSSDRYRTPKPPKAPGTLIT
jgi:uncharacterized protein YdaU (DUF1376 family)